MQNRHITLTVILCSVFFLLFSGGCKKELIIEDPAVVPENPLELTVNSSFDWKTTRDITLEVTGIAVPATIRNTLMVKSSDEKRVFLKNQVFMNQNYSLKFTIPAYETEVLITYGSIRKTIDITSDIVYFHYLAQ